MSNYSIGIEAGGTKFICAAGRGPDEILAQAAFPTRQPQETLGRTIEFIRAQVHEYGEPDAIGIASFGPVDLISGSPTYGMITSTPKPGWANCDIVGELRSAFQIPIGFDTDVNGAALGEWRWGAAQGLDTFIYMTIGTGIGGGVMANGKLLHGLLHPEMGHLLIRHDRQVDPFPGSCPYHGDCLEGLANGPALEKRWGQRAETLPLDHPAWELEAGYLAQAVANLVVTLSPQRVIMGGGVMNQAQIFPMLRVKVQQAINGYVRSPEILERIGEYIVPPALGGRAGVLGAIALAQDAARLAA